MGWSANHTLAAIAIAAATIGLPGTLWAVDQFTSMAIIDPVSGRRAAVTRDRALFITGNVTANESSLLNTVRGRGDANNGQCDAVLTPASGKSLLVKTINVNGMSLESAGYHFVTL
jgi:hypothetical protein